MKTSTSLRYPTPVSKHLLTYLLGCTALNTKLMVTHECFRESMPYIVSYMVSQKIRPAPCNTILDLVKAKFHYAVLVADRSEAGRRPAVSWNLAYHLAR